MNRKTGERIVIGAIAAAGLSAALMAMAPQALAQKKAAPKAAPKAAATTVTAAFRDCPSCPEMVRIPGGTFTMGSPAAEMFRNEDEGPQREVTVKPFAAGKFEITFEEWDACVADGGCPAPPGGAAAPAAAAAGAGRGGGAAALAGVDQALVIQLIQQSGGDPAALARLAGERGISPAQIQAIQALITGQSAAAPSAGGQQRGGAQVAQGGRGGAAAPASPGADGGFGRGKQPAINISWGDAQTYIAWLNRKTGKQYRLLTEAEWEYAARAGSKTTYFWGDKAEAAGHDYAHFEGVAGKDTFATRPAPVGSLNPNPWGLYDTTGNAAEWVQDCWRKDYASAPRDGSAWQEPGCNRVLRGSSWASSEELHRSANRDWVGETYKSASTGFRVARGL